MPALQRCIECGKQVTAEHAFTKRCLLNQVAKSRLEISKRGITDSGNMERALRASCAFENLASYCCNVRKMMAGRPTSSVTTPAVPMPAYTDISCRATDVAVMVDILSTSFDEAGLSRTSSVDIVRLLMAAFLTALGFTSAFAAVIGIPPLAVSYTHLTLPTIWSV